MSDVLIPVYRLVDAAEIATRLRVNRGTVHKWRQRGQLPKPVRELAIGPIWDWLEVLRWAQQENKGASSEFYRVE